MTRLALSFRPAIALALGAATLLGGCNVAQELSMVGQVPPLSPITSPTAAAGYQPVQLPAGPSPQQQVAQANALWQAGSTSFFRDQRASKVNDVLMVRITIDDLAAIQNQTQRSSNGTTGMGLSGAVGAAVGSILPVGSSADALIGVSGNSASAGAGSVNRTEVIQTVAAVLVVQVLPNGYLVVEGRQEVRVNFEVRELYIAGIVRPADIAADNSVTSSRIAELRLSYGGRGQISQVQQPAYGQQVLDTILPF